MICVVRYIYYREKTKQDKHILLLIKALRQHILPPRLCMSLRTSSNQMLNVLSVTQRKGKPGVRSVIVALTKEVEDAYSWSIALKSVFYLFIVTPYIFSNEQIFIF